jgi:hypothetical protein
MYYSEELHAKLEEVLGPGSVLAREVDIVSAA